MPLVVVTPIGVAEAQLSAATGAARVAAGTVSVLVGPVIAMRVRSGTSWSSLAETLAVATRRPAPVL